jgi:CRP/FNR family transcriptional regulator
MALTRATAAQQAGTGYHEAISSPCGVPRRAGNTTLSLLRAATAQVDDLKRALLLSQQESIAAREHVAILTSADAQRRCLAFQREVARSPMPCSSVFASTDMSLCTGLDPDELALVEPLFTRRTRFRKGDTLYRVGDAFDALCAIRVGSCKTVLLGRGGEERVAGYHIIGDVIGIDGISSDVHECQATALEDMEVCRLPFDRVETVARCSDRFAHNLHKVLSQECSRVQGLTLVLGTMCADKRLAVFLLDLSRRYQARGFSSCEFVLRLTREEIGSHLGLKLETVSRAFSRFQDQGVLQVQGRLVKLLDQVALKQIAE